MTLAASYLIAALSAAVAAQPAFVEVPGGKLWVESRGAGDPLVLVHDGLLPSESWDEQVEAFARHFTVVRYDRRHYGRSTTTTDDYSNVADLLAVLDHFGFQKATLVGCSAGGGLVLDFALEHPERTQALVLAGPVVSGFGYTGHFIARGMANRGQTGDKAEAVRNWAKDPYITDARNTEARARLQQLLERYPFIAAGGDPGGRPPARPALKNLGEVKVPTLLITGASDIPDVHAHIGAIAAGIPQAERTVIPAAGHLAHFEEPAVFNDRVLDFLSPRTRVGERLAGVTQGGLSPEARHAFDYDAKVPLDVQQKSRESRP